MNVLDVIRNKGEYFQGDSLHYLIGVDENGNYVCEIDGEESYCSSCIKKIVEERNAEFERIGSKLFSEIHDISNDNQFVRIDSAIETCPEKDDFEQCKSCGAEINVYVLFTFSREIDHWIDADIVIDEISDSDVYRIYTCITSEAAACQYPKLVNQLRNKIKTN